MKFHIYNGLLGPIVDTIDSDHALIACTTEKATNSAGKMVMIHVKITFVLFVRRWFSTANSTYAALIGEHPFVIFNTNPIFMEKVR